MSPRARRGGEGGPIELSRSAARALMLHAIGLGRRPTARATKHAVLDAIRAMGALQIDTIHVVARSPYVVLWSRLGDFEPRWLEELLAERRIFEYWSHEACFLPIEDYGLYRALTLAGRKGFRSTPSWLAEHRDEADALLDRVRELGPVRSSDFKRTDGEKSGWWNWKPEKLLLEHLHSAGELMIAARQNFHRVYDVRERIVEGWDDADAPPLETVYRALALKTVRALGVATAKWVPDYFRTRKDGVADRLEALAAEGLLVEARVEGISGPAYVPAELAAHAWAAASGELKPTLTTLLSPFDPLVWDRKRAEELFDFEYRIECYTPAEHRRFGYFSLPILRRGELVGRLDPKAHRAEGVLEVKALHLEPGARVTGAFVADLRGALARFARWHNTPEVVVRWASDPDLCEALSS